MFNAQVPVLPVVLKVSAFLVLMESIMIQITHVNHVTKLAQNAQDHQLIALNVPLVIF